MLDLKAFEKDPENFEHKLRRRGEVEGLDELLRLLKERKSLVASLQIDQEQRNSASKKLSQASKEEIENARSELKVLSQNIKEKESALRELEVKLETLSLTIPNILREDVPVGIDESGNVEVLKVGTPRHFEFAVKDHVDLGHQLNIIDIPRAGKISGARFAFLRGLGCKLNRALIQYFVDFHTSRGDIELAPPYMVREQAMVGTGQLPKFKEDAFEARGISDEPMYLIPTAEVPVTNYFADEILDEKDLPLRFCAYSACFRAEAGAAGKDTRGLIRQHQFEKVEMVRFAMPAQADAELDEMVKRAGEMLSELGLPYRVVLKCSADTGFHAEKTYDLEVWLPAQNTYREVSSCSVFGSFQARRAKIRYRPEAMEGSKPKPELIVTLNGSGLPLGRVLVAILENHQQADGSIHIPKVLWPYMGGIKVIE
ncbi:serine--tRNA ligase [Candidatus Dependentiae bacterium]|nr:serine--tRNA ligase [Candidatus Dependentiae bacterium]